jgi:hypothetical protein
MGLVPTSANDPIFWLHHCNIDRTWNRWLNQGQGRVNPSDSSFLNQEYSYVDEQGNVVTNKVSDIISSATLGYTYDNVPNPNPLFAVAGRPSDRGEQKLVRLASTAQRKDVAAPPPKALALAPVTEKLTAIPDHREQLRAVVGGLKASSPGKVFVEIDQLNAKEPPSYTYGVYLNLPSDPDPEQLKKHYVGAINFFSKLHPPHQGPHAAAKPFSELLDATAVIARLKSTGLWNQDNIAVTVRPLLPRAPQNNSAAVQKRAEASAKRSGVTYGAIHLLAAP